MIRQEIKIYMKEHKDSIGFSHLEAWFTKKYQGVRQKECKRLLKEEYDHSLLYEELEEHFGQLTDKEKDEELDSSSGFYGTDYIENGIFDYVSEYFTKAELEALLWKTLTATKQ